MDLEQLMDIEISTVNKKNTSLMKSAASVYVVTQDEIKKKGARNVPEALRGVPGLHVAQINQNSWAIASRGFNGRFATKLLVLIDGRAVYTHTFSGVFWDELEVDINEIERIEVIKGPGGTLWGANAVSGIINTLLLMQEVPRDQNLQQLVEVS